jgi:hypothetical protein
MPQDTASFQLTAVGGEVKPGGRAWFEKPAEWPVMRPLPLTMALHAVMAQDTARFSLEFDYTDDELVMSLMMAAWDEEGTLKR